MTEESHQNQQGLDNNREAMNEGSTGLQYLLRTLHVLFIALRILIVLVILGVFLGGIFYVKEDEKVMLFRFGELVSKEGQEVLTSEKGQLYWAWPYPVDKKVRIPAEDSKTITTRHFWPQQQRERGRQQTLNVGSDGYLLTGDANIVHMNWSVTYEISDVKRYYLGFLSKENTFREKRSLAEMKEAGGAPAAVENVLCNAILKEVARWPIEDVWVRSQQGEGGESNENLTEAVQSRVRDAVREQNIGIEVQSVSLQDFQPPSAVKRAFEEIAGAANQYRGFIDEARQYKENTLAEAEAEASEMRAEARAYKTQTLEAVKAEANYFEDIQEKYQKRPESTLISLYTDTLRDVLTTSQSEYVIHTRTGDDQEIRLRIGPPAVDQSESKSESGNKRSAGPQNPERKKRQRR